MAGNADKADKADEGGTEIDLFDLVKQRVEAGEPIYVSGGSSALVDVMTRALAGKAGRTGKTPTLIHFVDVAKGPSTVNGDAS